MFQEIRANETLKANSLKKDKKSEKEPRSL